MVDVVTGDGGHSGDDDNGDVMMMMMMAATVVVNGGGYRRVAARGGGDQIDRLMRNLFGLGRKTHRKTFPTTADCGRRWGGGGC
ncbi:hypothetical protein Tco_0000641 [Tanacetum coccineum]